MLQEIATEYTGMPDFVPDFGPDFGPNPIEVQPQMILTGGYKYTPRCAHEELIISANINIPTCISNETVTSGKSITRLISPIRAHEFALDTLRTFENKWDAYIREEARLLFIFDEEEAE